jgi:hypothetical protein
MPHHHQLKNRARQDIHLSSKKVDSD